MRKRWQPIWCLVVLLVALCLLNVGVAFAASPEGAINEIMGGLYSGGGGFGYTFTNQLGGMSKSLLTAAKLIAVIMTAAAGCMVCFGIQDSRTAFWNWILGIGLAINFGDLLLNLWSVESVSAPPKIATYDLLLKSENDPAIDILSPFMRYYIGIIMQGAAAVAPYAINLTLILALIDGSIRLAFDLVGGDKVKFLVTTILKVGFFIFLINSWVGTNSNYQLMPALSSGFETMGYTAGGAQEMVTEYVKGNPDSNIEVQSNQIVTNALNFFNIFWESASQKNLLTILVGLVCVVAAVIILFLTALEMFMVRIEFWTMALITIPLLPFGVIDKLKFLSDKAIGAMFNLAIKIFVIAFLATMSVNILTGLVENAKQASTSADFMGNISYFLQVLLYALILFFLTKKIPALVSGLLSGNPSLGGMDMKQLATSAAKGAASAAIKGAGAAGVALAGMKALASGVAGSMGGIVGSGGMGSLAKSAGSKAMSMMGQAASNGMNALKTQNPVYQGYQRGMSMLGSLKGDKKDAGLGGVNFQGKSSSETSGNSSAGINLGTKKNPAAEASANATPTPTISDTLPGNSLGMAQTVALTGNGQRMSSSPGLQKEAQPTSVAQPTKPAQSPLDSSQSPQSLRSPKTPTSPALTKGEATANASSISGRSSLLGENVTQAAKPQGQAPAANIGNKGSVGQQKMSRTQQTVANASRNSNNKEQATQRPPIAGGVSPAMQPTTQISSTNTPGTMTNSLHSRDNAQASKGNGKTKGSDKRRN